ncbi:MAG: AMP-binding protein [Hellea sp.]
MDAGIMALGLDETPTDQDRYPTLSDAGRDTLRKMREHPAAPIFRNQSGNRLTVEDLQDLERFEAQLQTAKAVTAMPSWMSEFIEQTYQDVPYYRQFGARQNFEDVQPISRADLSRDVAQFVPDSVDLSRMMHFQTSGTTGHPLFVPSHPQVAGRYLSFHKRALSRFGITPQAGPGEVGAILLGYQARCFTYVSVTPQMGESGLAKINLHPNDWKQPRDRAAYLEAMAAEIVTGDPISFEALLDVDARLFPKALISVAMMLPRGLRAALEARFGCPVLDIYSMNEVGPIALFDPDVGGHVLLQDRLYVEVLDDDDQPIADGERGEITVTGGFNFCLPLLRYKTGDFGRLGSANSVPVIYELEARRPIRFLTASGEWINNVDITHAMAGLRASRYCLHQQGDKGLVLRLPDRAMGEADKARAILGGVMGALPLSIKVIETDDKQLQYTSEL